MSADRFAVLAFLLSSLSAQGAATVPNDRLPRLLQLGPMPAGAEAAAVLRIDRGAPMSTAVALLSEAQAQGRDRVHFAATLPDGTPGCFTLALPEKLEPPTTVDLRLHHERVGVPPSSVVPLLRRIAKDAQGEFVLGVDAPGNVPFEQVLAVLAAVSDAGVARVALRAGPAQTERNSELLKAPAMDLWPIPMVQVPPLSLPPGQPHISPTAIGCLERADIAWSPFLDGGAGGRYGGRGGGRRGKLALDAINLGKSWIARQQLTDGSFSNDAGAPDLDATSLVMLAWLGDGTTLDRGADHDELRRASGWVLGRQREDGRFADPGPGSVRSHALATYALSEASGLSPSGCLLRGSMRDAVERLAKFEHPGGGFPDGTTAADPDCVSTALSMCALASARFFGIEATPTPAQLVAWFDAVASPAGHHRMRTSTPADSPHDATATAAALFSRFFGGQDPKEVPVMPAAADCLLATADEQDPWCCYWTTYALFQIGGRHWKTWNDKVAALVDAQIGDGQFKGTWEPAGGCSRLTTTALRLVTLQAYYRYTRLVR